jgi:hypothetical protein
MDNAEGVREKCTPPDGRFWEYCSLMCHLLDTCLVHLELTVFCKIQVLLF